VSHAQIDVFFCLGNLRSKVFPKEAATSSTVEPCFYDRRFNDISGLTLNILCPGKSYGKLYGAEYRSNNIRFNDIPGITTEN